MYPKRKEKKDRAEISVTRILAPGHLSLSPAASVELAQGRHPDTDVWKQPLTWGEEAALSGPISRMKNESSLMPVPTSGDTLHRETHAVASQPAPFPL